MIPVAIKPNGSYRSIIGKQFFHLLFHEIEIAVVVLHVPFPARVVAGSSYWIILSHPIEQGIIVMQVHPLVMAGISQILQYILAPRCLLDYVVIRAFRVIHRKSVVMPGSYGDILCSSILECFYPLACIVPCRIESACSLGILIFIQFSCLKIPFALGVGGIDSPMKEYSESLSCEFLPVLNIFFRRRISLSERGRRS